MVLKIGFVLLTHNKPLQAARLVGRLNCMFDAPPIAWHHDFTQCDLPLDSVTENVSLIRPHFQTGWAKFSTVEAGLAAIATLFDSKQAPDWFILLSGSDYPIKAADKIASDLSTSQYDAHISHEKIRFNNYERDWQRLCYERYCIAKLRVPFVNRRLRPVMRTISLHHPLIAKPFLPFSSDFSCCAGEFWFCANRTAARYLIDFHKTKIALANHYRRLDKDTIFPEESYCQTILCNSPHLKISQNNWRYVDWSRNDGKDSHPKTLLIDDLTKVMDSPAHFARKFDSDVDKEIMDALDAVT